MRQPQLLRGSPVGRAPMRVALSQCPLVLARLRLSRAALRIRAVVEEPHGAEGSPSGGGGGSRPARASSIRWARRQRMLASEPRPGVGEEDLIELNVGGRLMQTARSTLLAVPGSRLAVMFRKGAEGSLSYDAGGRVWLDLDPTLFQLVLRYLRELRMGGGQPRISCLPAVTPADEAPFRRLLSYLGLLPYAGAPIPLALCHDPLTEDPLLPGTAAGLLARPLSPTVSTRPQSPPPPPPASAAATAAATAATAAAPLTSDSTSVGTQQQQRQQQHEQLHQEQQGQQQGQGQQRRGQQASNSSTRRGAAATAGRVRQPAAAPPPPPPPEPQLESEDLIPDVATCSILAERPGPEGGAGSRGAGEGQRGAGAAGSPQAIGPQAGHARGKAQGQGQGQGQGNGGGLGSGAADGSSRRQRPSRPCSTPSTSASGSGSGPASASGSALKNLGSGGALGHTAFAAAGGGAAAARLSPPPMRAASNGVSQLFYISTDYSEARGLRVSVYTENDLRAGFGTPSSPSPSSPSSSAPTSSPTSSTSSASSSPAGNVSGRSASGSNVSASGSSGTAANGASSASSSSPGAVSEPFDIFIDATYGEAQLSLTFVSRREILPGGVFLGLTSRAQLDRKGAQIPCYGWKSNGCTYNDHTGAGRLGSIRAGSPAAGAGSYGADLPLGSVGAGGGSSGSGSSSNSSSRTQGACKEQPLRADDSGANTGRHDRRELGRSSALDSFGGALDGVAQPVTDVDSERRPLWSKGDSVELILRQGQQHNQLLLKVNGRAIDVINRLPSFRNWCWYVGLWAGGDVSCAVFQRDQYAVYWGDYSVKRYL